MIHKWFLFMSSLFMCLLVVVANADVMIIDPGAPLLSEKQITKTKVNKASTISKASQNIHVLSSIFISASKKIAIMNNKQYSEGGLVRSY
ncbi:MAG: hypothetical protein ACJAUP_001911 [Cellvibrionaceae bacterium]|jgi:hypothetical protein